MSPRAVALVVVVAFGVMLYARYLRFPFAELLSLAVAGLMFWLGLSEDRAPLVLVGALLPLPLFGLRIPFVSDGGGRRGDENIRFTGEEQTVQEPARHVAGVFASRWPRGQLELTGNQLRFVTDDGDEVFSTEVSLIERVSLGSWARAQLTVRTEDGARHAVAFGHNSLGRGDVRTAQVFWRDAIAERQATPAP